MPRRTFSSALPVLLALSCASLALSACDGGVATCAAGDIQIVELEIGQGLVASEDSRVRLTYNGRIEDGREVAAETDISVTLSSTAPPGFRQGVAGMRENGRRRFTLPPNLGFGPDGGPAGIPACEQLTFTVELHEILAQACGNNGSLITEDQAPGSGPAATATDRVTVNYTLSLSDGTVVETRNGFSFFLNDASLVQGFRQGIVGMLAAGRRRLRVPPNLGYGPDGIPGSIPGCATLIFDIELVSIG